jgi:hypothetical protein
MIGLVGRAGPARVALQTDLARRDRCWRSLVVTGIDVLASAAPALTARSGHQSEEEAHAQSCPCAVR